MPESNFKQKTPRDQAYMQWLRTKGCHISRCTEPAETVVAHHAGSGGVGIKCSDYYTLPLCDGHHKEHDRGSVTFYKKYAIDKWRAIAEYLERFIIEGDKEA